jgi:hypothetical protein
MTYRFVTRTTNVEEIKPDKNLDLTESSLEFILVTISRCFGLKPV